jgi:acyl-CoA synthetase (AMP-forming)/AMP-acid ligase II/3-hydroxymyristoyl/3-hydroxydecanoyl-(acyl carrier protein) dehydratase
MREPPAPAIDMLQVPYAGCAADCTVAYRDGHAVSKRRFHARTAAWQQLLAAATGHKFALFLEDSIDFSSALYGAWLAGKTVYLPGDTLSASCTALAAVVDGFLGDFDAVWSPLRPVQPEKNPADTGDSPPLQGHGKLSGDFEGIVVYTSGSSGVAQAIPKRLSQLAAEVATLEKLFGDRLGDADVLATVSHQHIYGLLFKVLWPLAAQRAVHVRSAVFLEELLPWMQSRPCLLVSSPAHLSRFPENAGNSPQPLPTGLRAVFSSGGPLTAKAADDTVALFGIAPIEIYGSSETGGIAWRCRGESWTALPGVQWRVQPDEGVLEVRSPHLRDADWLRMADRATIANRDSDSDVARFLLQGRTDRIVKLAEKRISLDAIERRLCASPLVTEARVLLPATSSPSTTPSRRTGIAAFIVLSESGRAALAAEGKLALNRQLKSALSDTVEAVALPRSWRYLDALPLNAQGKTTQSELLSLLNPSHPVSPTNPSRPTMPDVRLCRQEPDNIVLELHIPGNLLYFDGHFDAAPILPGIAQLNWAIGFGHQYFDLPPVFTAVHALKFQKIIAPGSTVMLELQHDPSKAALHFSLHSASGQHASGRIMFAHADMADTASPAHTHSEAKSDV